MLLQTVRWDAEFSRVHSDASSYGCPFRTHIRLVKLASIVFHDCDPCSAPLLLGHIRPAEVNGGLIDELEARSLFHRSFVHVDNEKLDERANMQKVRAPQYLTVLVCFLKSGPLMR